MKSQTKTKSFLLLLALPILGLIGYAAWRQFPRPSVGSQERKIACYQDSMHPWIKSDGPGKCTICAMDLTPIYEGQAGFASGGNLVSINSNQITVLDVQTEEVKRRTLRRSLRVAGALEANETSKTVVSAPARGRIDALTVDYAGVEVEKGQKLITMFSPELVQMRKTLLAVRQSTQPGATNSLSQANVDAGIYTGVILAPQAGLVLDRNVYNGQYVAEGDRLLTIVDASLLWFRFDVYQEQLPWFEIGETIEVEVVGIPGKVFTGVISFLEPNFNEATRTIKVRADIQNPVVEVQGHKRRLLKYGMYAEGHVRAEVPEVLAVPRTAVLFPGDTSYAYLEKGGGAYERRRLKLGRQGDEFWEVLKGLEEGESVVTSGNLLLDAQAQFTLGANPEPVESEALAIEKVPALQAPEAMSHLAMPVKASAVQEASAKPKLPVMPPATASAGKATPTVPRPRSTNEHAAAGRTQRMSAMMSPGSELQMIRRAAILEELAMGTTNAPAPTPEPLANPIPSEPSAQVAPAPEAQPPANEAPAHSPVDPAPQTSSAEIPAIPIPITAGDNKPEATGAAALVGNQRELLQAFLTEANGVSQALAADNLKTFNTQIAKLPALLQPLTNALPATSPLGPPLRNLAALKWHPAQDLADARKQFLPFSTTVAELAKQLRKQDLNFASLKIYHCPMAPEPGLWMQARGPLRNPFFGAKMLKCGEEVLP